MGRNDRDTLIGRLARARSRSALAAQRVARRCGLHIASRRSHHLVERGWNSPIAELRLIDNETWESTNPMVGFSIDLETQFRLLESALARFLREPVAPPRGDGEPEFTMDNGFYGPVDAELLHAMIRWLKPRRIVELGSGYSTLVMAAAVTCNEAEGHPCRFEAFNPHPYPLDLRAARLPGLTAHHKVGAEALSNEVGASLGDGDVLFVDTSHIVRIGGDTVAIVLEHLPRLAPGVVVHFHDVFLPWDYPRSWVESFEAFSYAEQYLLQAFLTFNERFRVLCAAYALARADPGRLRATIPSVQEGVFPRAFWLRRAS
jgi:hypothetical protein